MSPSQAQSKTQSKTQSKILAGVVLFLTLTFALSPLATIDFSGFSADRFPIPQNNPPVQPAGYAFSIWGVIYLWLILGAAYGFMRTPKSEEWRPMRQSLAVSLLIGTFWIAAANFSPLLSTGMIVVMAGFAIKAMLSAGPSDEWLQARPVALYAGWLTAATGVAIGVSLGGYGLMSNQSAAILCLIGVLGVAIPVQAARPREWGYPAAVIWALVGVMVTNLKSENWLIVGLAALGIAVLALRLFQSLAKKGA